MISQVESPGLTSIDEAGRIAYPGNLLILGASSQGELFTPVRVTSLEEAKDFGEGELVDAFADLLRVGKSSAYLVRIGEGFESDAERQEALRQAYRHLEDFPCHVVVPLGAKTGRGYAQDLAYFLDRYFPVGYALGVLGTPDIDAEDVEGSLEAILSAPELFGALGDTGKVLCAVVSPILVGGHPINAQVLYGALLSKLAVGVSPTNQPIQGGEVPWSLDEKAWSMLHTAGITGWINRPHRGVYVSTALTLGPNPFRLQSTMRCLQAIMSMLEAVADSYIGRPVGGYGQDKSLENDLLDALDTARQLGYLRSYAVQLDWRRLEGEVVVALDLTLWHEIRQIHLMHSVRVN